MTRLEVNYYGDSPDHGEQAFLDELKNVSTLQVLVVTEAPLKFVRHVYEDDPSALTEEVFLDACWYCSSLEILQYLKDRVPSEYYAPQKIAPIILERMDTGAELYDLNIETLSKLFPEAMTYSEKPNNYTGCPLERALWGDDYRENYSDQLVEEAVQMIPSTIKGFTLPTTDIDSHVRTFFKPIATALAKSQIETLWCDEHEWRVDEFLGFFTVLLPGAKNLQTLRLSVPRKESAGQDLFASFPTDWLTACKISSLSLCLGDDIGILPRLVVHMQQLKNLNLTLGTGNDVAVQDFCKLVCQVLALGRLESLTVSASNKKSESDGLLCPLLDAAGSSTSLSKFHLYGLHKESRVHVYQDRMITILKSNTFLKDVLINCTRSGTRTYDPYHERIPTEEENKQKLIDYFTTLNSCGRDLARDSAKASDLVKVLVGAPENLEKSHRASYMPVVLYLSVAQVLYGLLRESPGTWSANALGQDFIIPQGRGVKRKRQFR